MVTKLTTLFSFIIFFFLTFPFVARAQGRAPHGLAYESPMAFSPAAFEFFHPTAQRPVSSCAQSLDCAPLPLSFSSVSSAVAQSTQAYQSKLSKPPTSSSGIRVGGIAGIVFGFVFAVLLAMGLYYVVTMRRANINRSISVRPDV
ncbi:PREDICTED: uncharacterized protein LOC104594853 [Nelumbo nucifera]|uniref:Uncharacterized protein LOC104594853 n=2 Tax=Nelumbo nucifera TaxID=4432 RepID=A0A1U7ZIG2_NELNU|nr:PREDICTED: uncharacterized protein LOC104594853 [Nelumbo nucifera]DAD26177.1 TPA_asm: hypothetical protein HUJ06_027645 [Nelumbo nucifera]